MATKLNAAGARNARAMIRAGKVNRTASWSISADDENAMLGPNGDDWANYAKWHLGEDPSAAEDTKARYKYPIGTSGEVYRAALVACRQRAGQQNAMAIMDEAGSLMEMMDKSQAHGPFEIVAAGEDAVDVLVYGDIGGWAEESTSAAKFVRDLQTVKAKTLNVRINSYGGSVSDALAIYNALRRHPANVNVAVDGVAVSAASLIAMAGERTTIAENGLLMIHGPIAMAAGNAVTLREMADVLDRYARAMAPSYAAKTGQPVADMLALLTDGEDHWYTASEAHAAGFVDDIAAAAPVEASFDLGRYRGVPAAAAAFQRSMNMPDKPTPAAAPTAATPHQPPAAAPDPAPAAAPALAVVPAAGRTREQNVEIRAAFEPFLARDGIRAAYEAVLLDPSITVDAARKALLDALGKGVGPATPIGVAPRVEMGASEGEKFVAAASEALVARAGFASPEARARLGANPYRGSKLLDLARASLERAGLRADGMGQMEIVASAFALGRTSTRVRAQITQGTSDFPVILENTMHKVLQQAYATQPDTWSRFCATGTVSDFRAHNRYRTGSFGSLDTVNELGEFKNKSIPDGEKSSITASTKGNIINISRQAVVNDDLGAFVGLAAMLGRAARRTVEVDVYALLAENSGYGPTMSDTGTLFNSTALTAAGGHANRAAYAAPTVVLIDGARQAMASQKDVSGNEYLDLRPMIWVGRLSDGGTMRVINAAQYDPDTANKLQRPNMVANLFRDIVDTPRITWNAWYVFADPSVAPVIEVAFLDGVQEPYLELQQGFEVDGARYKVRLDYGVAEMDFRGGYASVGA